MDRGPEPSVEPRASQAPRQTWDQRWRRTEPLRRRIALGALVGSVGGLAVALVDAAWVARALAEPPSLIALWLAAAGVTVPLTGLVGVVFGLVSWLLHPRAEPSLPGFVAQLRATASGRPADVAAFAPLAALAVFTWATLSAQLARAVLSAEAPAQLIGAAIAMGSIALGAVLALVTLAATPWLRQQLARAQTGWERAVDPATTLAIAIAVIALLVGYGAWRGTVSGEGGVLGIYGILKRNELDLRAPGLLLALSLAVYLAPPLLRRLKPYQACIVALLPLALTLRSATALEAEPDLAAAVERTAPLSAKPLKTLRKLSDRDGDGAGRLFGGGDCDDTNPAIGPGADDVPDNGIDEDCSGTDLSLAGIAPAPAPAKPVPQGLRAKLPPDGNVILITIDTLRYDLGYTGYARPISPNIDAMAARSQLYERAYALASYTGKSVGPTLIGKYGSETHRNWGHFNKFSAEDTFIAERLQRGGIRTIAVHGHRYFGEFGGLERGFDELDLSAAPPEEAKWDKEQRATSHLLTDAAIKRLQDRDGRFFLWVHYLDPHADYIRHEGIETFGNGSRALYDHEVLFTDTHVGRLLDFVKKQPWADKTSIILTSDHGEAFGEHNDQYMHGVELWEELVRVPLLVEVPGVAPKRYEVRRSLIDLAPTILDLFGLAMPSGEGDDFFSGTSLVPDWFEEPAPRDIYIDMPGGPYNEPRVAFIHQDLKLIISRGTHKELYDLKEDPRERKNVWRQQKEAIEAPFALFKKRLKEIEVTGDRKY